MILPQLIALLLSLQPATQPALIPATNAQTLADRLGPIEVITIHYSRQRGDDLEKWDVIITDRELLTKVESMRRSDWRGEVLLVHNYSLHSTIDKTKFTGFLGNIKYTGHPFAVRLKAPSQPWVLFIGAGDAGAELTKLIEDEALKQRPKEPVTKEK